MDNITIYRANNGDFHDEELTKIPDVIINPERWRYASLDNEWKMRTENGSRRRILTSFKQQEFHHGLEFARLQAAEIDAGREFLTIESLPPPTGVESPLHYHTRFST